MSIGSLDSGKKKRQNAKKGKMQFQKFSLYNGAEKNTIRARISENKAASCRNSGLVNYF
jgi:hypothetical protein